MVGIKINTDNKYAYVTLNYRHIVENNWLEDLQYICEPTVNHYKRACARFICDRGVSHELVRHRIFSFMQESTRYCNYSTDKFNNELTFIIPSWSKNLKPKCYTPETSNEMLFVESCLASEKAYLNMLGNKATPQEARQVLPNALKTEINMCGYLIDWKYFFKLRTAPNAHPDMIVLAKQLEQLFNEQNLWKNSTY